MRAYSSASGISYESWDDLVKAESNGYVVVALSSRPGTVPMVAGPWQTKAEASKARARIRYRLVRDEGRYKVSTYIRVLWREPQKP